MGTLLCACLMGFLVPMSIVCFTTSVLKFPRLSLLTANTCRYLCSTSFNLSLTSSASWGTFTKSSCNLGGKLLPVTFSVDPHHGCFAYNFPCIYRILAAVLLPEHLACSLSSCSCDNTCHGSPFFQCTQFQELFQNHSLFISTFSLEMLQRVTAIGRMKANSSGVLCSTKQAFRMDLSATVSTISLRHSGGHLRA